MSPGDAVGRVFVGVDLSDEVRAAVAAHLSSFSPLPGRPSPPQNWHITLRFLGQTTSSRLEVLRHRLDEAALGGPFPPSLSGLGAFPRAAAATVLWLGCDEGAAGLGELAAAAEEAAVAAGFSPEERPFHPHLTLSRIRPQRDLRSWLEAVPPLRAAQTVDAISIYRSHLGGTGPPRYEIIDRVVLGVG